MTAPTTFTPAAARLAELADRGKARALRRMLGLPARAQRRLAGAPVVRDGQTLDPETQWLLRLQRLSREPGPETQSIELGRQTLRRQAQIVGGRQPVGATTDLTVGGAEGPLGARLYIPRSQVHDE